MSKRFEIRSILGLAVLAVLSGVLLWQSQPATTLKPPAPEKDQNFYLIDFEIRRFTEEGRLQQILRGDELRHFESLQMADVRPAEVTVFNDDDRAIWTIRANKAQIYHDRDEVQLSEGVVLTSVNPNAQAAQVETEVLTMYPKRESAETQTAVVIDFPAGQTKAVGMTIDMKRQQLSFLSQVRSELR